MVPLIGCYLRVNILKRSSSQSQTSHGSLWSKFGEIRDTKTLNLSSNIVSLQVLVDVFTLRDQLVAQ